jgi:hypothetical protein
MYQIVRDKKVVAPLPNYGRLVTIKRNLEDMGFVVSFFKSDLHCNY